MRGPLATGTQILLLVAAAGCASAPAPRTAERAAPPPVPPPAAAPASRDAAAPSDRIGAGWEPWWADVAAGRYRIERSDLPAGPWLVAVGRSHDHHHRAEGLLDAKVMAHLALRELFGEEPPRPRLIDLFVSPEGDLFVLLGLRLEGRRERGAAQPPTLAPPPSVIAAGPHRVGPHQFHDDRHLYLECEIEGPLANPNWGAERALARLAPRETP